jgi:hypothetical protein
MLDMRPGAGLIDQPVTVDNPWGFGDSLEWATSSAKMATERTVDRDLRCGIRPNSAMFGHRHGDGGKQAD